MGIFGRKGNAQGRNLIAVFEAEYDRTMRAEVGALDTPTLEEYVQAHAAALQSAEASLSDMGILYDWQTNESKYLERSSRNYGFDADAAARMAMRDPAHHNHYILHLNGASPEELGCGCVE